MRGSPNTNGRSAASEKVAVDIGSARWLTFACCLTCSTQFVCPVQLWHADAHIPAPLSNPLCSVSSHTSPLLTIRGHLLALPIVLSTTSFVFCYTEPFKQPKRKAAIAMSDSDGDLSNVNPDLLRLCANADEWREQRRRAMKAKIFGSGAGSTGDASSTASAYLPSDASAGPSPSTNASTNSAIPASQQASEAYILQQILSHKRRREDANTQQQANATPGGPAATNTLYPQQPAQQHNTNLYAQTRPQQMQPHSYNQQQPYQQQQQAGQGESELSLKEKLMRKYSKS